ncbi:MAG: hypothetical protein QOE90_2352 [Thermoplasmata archaeon]|jgi:integrase|nr:hypothetical protein [Thermoplasmata archaeon]
MEISDQGVRKEPRKDYRTRRAAAFVEKVLERLPSPNREIAGAYFEKQRAKGNTLSSLVNVGSYLLQLDAINPGRSFRELTPSDLTRTLTIYGATHSPASTFRFAVYLKALYTWVHDADLPRAYREALRVKKPKSPRKRPLTEDEFRALLGQAWGSNLTKRGWMRQALLWVLWDSGFRISEALALRVGSVIFDDQEGAHLEMPRDAPHLKTGPRTIYVSESVPALRVWLQHHPARGDPSAPLFPSNHEPDAPLEPTTVNKILRDYSKAGKLDRIVTCHIFRHTRATRAAKAGWNEPKLNAYFGWAPGSRESSTYVHLAAVDVEAEIRAAARIDPVGAMIREDPTKALQTAVAAAVAQAVPTAVAETIRQLRAGGTGI